MLVDDFEGDSITFTYSNIARCELRRVSDALATLEEMASDNPSSQVAPFDIVFVDADKTRLIEYVNTLVNNDRVLKKGGLILVDNVLWKGLVLDVNNNGSGCDSSDEGVSDDDSTESKEVIRKNRRARKLANKMQRFNSAVVKDDRVEVLMLPIRDGLSLIRKR
jgi:caffeoyl-CoA O-methyltransferase